MSISCAKCGSSLAEGQPFCTTCGTRAPVPSAAETPRFCTGCGVALSIGAKFCEKCGASAASPQSPSASVPSPAAPRIQAVNAAAPAQVSSSAPALPGKSGGKFLKIIMIVAILFVVFLLVVMGSCAYIAYRAKQRFNKVEQAYKKDDLAGMVAAATGETSKPQPLPDWRPAPADLVSAPSSKIPLRKSLRTINVGSDPLRGDFESIYSVDSVTDEAVHIKASQQYPSGDKLESLLGGTSNKSQKPRTIQCGRTVFRKDMEDSVETDGYFCREGSDEKRPGTTAMSISKKEFNELKNTGQAEVIFHEDPLRVLLKSFKNAMNSDNSSSDAASTDLMKKMMSFAPGNSMPMDTPAIKYTIRRQGDADLAFPVLVNDQAVELPVIDVLCKHPDGQEGHVYVLDDPDNPLFLAAASESLGREQVTKIYWDQDKPSAPNQLELDLEKNGRAKVYDLYFDFASSTLRPESDKVLKEIAQVMRQHPDWKLSVEGHTDNIGGNASNLDLSKHRAQAVVSALAADYAISETRFTTAGFGASRPVDTNDTLEGRARNRRVELVRQ
jgi:outer membrane protein OmpA-like peptidoglycan-associated protein